MKRIWLLFYVLACLLVWGVPAHAQWITQSSDLSAGWNAVYLHVDASHTELENLVDDAIEEVWLWEPAPVAQYLALPQNPEGASSRWVSWSRTSSVSVGLDRLIGNAAYLVRVENGTADFTWRVKGKALAPSYSWSSTGLNFLGFPTPSSTSPTFRNFFAPEATFLVNAKIYAYTSGALGASNPALLSSIGTSPPLNRSKAYWIESGQDFNRYFGPFELNLLDTSGLEFKENLGQSRLRLKNVTDQDLTITIEEIPSELAPTGQPTITAMPPLLLRGDFDANTLSFRSNVLTGTPQIRTLKPKGQPGSEVELIIGLNRNVLNQNGTPGDFYAGVVRFTDSLSLSQIDVPVSAKVETSTVGLWVGEASVSSVSHFLKSHSKASDADEFQALLEQRNLTSNATGPPSFLETTSNITARAKTSASILWRPPEWLTVGESGEDQRTPDLSNILQELVNGGAWKRAASNEVAFTFIGNGRRVAVAYDSDPAGAPELALEYALPSNANEFEAYNDLSWADGQLSENITRFTTAAGPSVPPFDSSGALIDYETGLPTTVSLSVTGGSWNEAIHTTLGALSDPGTDAYNTFNNKVDATGVINNGANDVVLTFSGLDPQLHYEVVVFGNRNNSRYTDRISRTTLSGAQSFRNESSRRRLFNGANDPSTTIVNGSNTSNGYVARYTQIAPGTDGTIQITQADGGSANPPKPISMPYV